jgi:SAM-dependent methyltransferase
MTRIRVWLLMLVVCAGASAAAQSRPAPQEAFEPQVGQAGKDVVWVPTPDALVEKMLDLANVTPQDIVVDLGSGDGRNVIAAAKRGARARGIEFNPSMVELSRRKAAEAGVGDKATFVQADMYEADISDATVLALFLLTTNLEQLTPKFLELAPGTRIVDNTFAIPGWTPDATETLENCASWCTALLWIVPAIVEGTWHMDDGRLTITQKFQMVSGTLMSGSTAAPVENGRLRADQLTFSAAGIEYRGRVTGNRIDGILKSPAGERPWRATKLP